MIVEIKVPSVGESVTEALLAEWYRPDGAQIRKGELVFVIETDKVTLEVEAEAAGRLEILVTEGETVPIGTVVGRIDTAAAEAAAPPPAEADQPQPPPEPVKDAKPPEPAPAPEPQP
ncbi:MAG: dihydrolipoamide succinyltransferase, partial [Desulfosarcina sp.]|nr:dihydrolipoamide succinyltransferase [Desulfobacterales bacterium]